MVVFQEKKWEIANQESNFSRILTYNESGLSDFESEIEEYEDAFFRMTQEAGELLTDNIQDKTIREGLMHVGWVPDQRDYPAAADAVEWWLYDGEQAYTPEETSLVFNSVSMISCLYPLKFDCSTILSPGLIGEVHLREPFARGGDPLALGTYC